MEERQISAARGFRAVLVGLAMVAPEALQAIVPDIQLVGENIAQLRQVVRVYHQDGRAGTGTIFHVKDADQGHKWLCILTADHVVAGANNVRIGFGSIPYGGPPGTLYDAGTLYYRGGLKEIDIPGDPIPHNPDIAVVGVRVPNNVVANITPTQVIVDNTGDNAISMIGYGTTGVLSQWTANRLGYVQDLRSYGTKRFANNLIERRGVGVRVGYYYAYYESDLNNPTDANWRTGEGAMLFGDSGGPAYISRNVPIDLVTGGTINTFTEFQMGVNTYISNFDFVDNNGDGTFQPGFDQVVMLLPGNAQPGSTSGGVRILPEYHEWIEESCRLVPEPTSILVLSMGTLLILARKRRRA